MKESSATSGSRPAAYNAGPTALANWLAGKGPMPFETQSYVLAITGHDVEEWRTHAPPLSDSSAPSETCLALIAKLQVASGPPVSRPGLETRGQIAVLPAIEASPRTGDQTQGLGEGVTTWRRWTLAWVGIVNLVDTSGPSTVRLSLAEADAYLASFGDLWGTAARRADLASALCASLPNTVLADEVIEAIASGTGGA